MANTSGLTNEIATGISNYFCEKYNCCLIDIPKKKLEEFFSGMNPDVVAYDKDKATLYVGEITTSGYLGSKGKDFHLGGVKKLAEIFSKFYLINNNENYKRIISSIKEEYEHINPNRISCHMIVPKKSKFINALGYREQLVSSGVFILDKIDLHQEMDKQIVKLLTKSRNEQKKNKV